MSKANKMSVFQLTILTAVNMMGSGKSSPDLCVN